jgi:hypothetical protein
MTTMLALSDKIYRVLKFTITLQTTPTSQNYAKIPQIFKPHLFTHSSFLVTLNGTVKKSMKMDKNGK